MTIAASPTIPALVLGGTGYVAGELLRLLASHPAFGPVTIVSDSRPGTTLADAFPHLAPAYGEQCYASFEAALEIFAGHPRSAIFCAAPHGAAADLVRRLLQATAGREGRIVDMSADHRFADAAEYAAVYGEASARQTELDLFTCALPEHLALPPTRHVAHPGCFASAMLLALVPLLAADLIEPDVYVTGVTGSTGSGRTPGAGTHHPDRHADLYAYKPLAHRHAPEVEAVCRRVAGRPARVHFVPQSGPYARGIHVTLQARLRTPLSSDAVRERFAEHYAASPFVSVRADAPHVKHVAGSNYAALSATARGVDVAVLCAIDNLTKGAAGGAVQWMNRLHGLPDTLGLLACAAGWT